jgi:predicted branched-subunit amino acid permease
MGISFIVFGSIFGMMSIQTGLSPLESLLAYSSFLRVGKIGFLFPNLVLAISAFCRQDPKERKYFQ